MSTPDPQPTHECPGCAAPGIEAGRVACPDCWARLPDDLRWMLRSTHGVNPGKHAIAVRYATAWFREHRIERGSDT